MQGVSARKLAAVAGGRVQEIAAAKTRTTVPPKLAVGPSSNIPEGLASAADRGMEERPDEGGRPVHHPETTATS